MVHLKLNSGFKIVLYKSLNISFKTVTTNSQNNVIIPKRIEREPTDILRALASVFKRDPTANHYKFPDDPYFSLNSNFFKKLSALSIESGRKSAKWIVDNNPEYFKSPIAEPSIKAFLSPSNFDETVDINEEVLLNAINEKNIDYAIAVYNLIMQKNIELSSETQQMLLELVCFYNSEIGENELYYETKWLKGTEKENIVKSWKDDGFAEQLFARMNSNCPAAYSAIIEGMLNHGQIEKALELFQQAKNKNLVLSAGVYNKIIANIQNVREGGRYAYILELLKEMESKKIKPNLNTLNSILESLPWVNDYTQKSKLAMMTLSEFANLGVEPSLGTYYFLIKIKNKEARRWEISQEEKYFWETILKELYNSKLEIRHPADTLFFPAAMESFYMTFKSAELGRLLHKVLLKGENLKFLNSTISEKRYYRHYFSLTIKYEPIENTIEIYRDIVPSVFSPDSQTYQVLLKEIQDNNAYDLLLEVWKEIKRSKHMHLILLPDVLQMVSGYDWENEKTSEVFHEAAHFGLQEINKAEGTNVFNDGNLILTDSLLSNMLIVFSKFQNIESAVFICDTAKNTLGDVSLSHDALTAFYDLSISNGMVSHLMNCLKLSEMANHPKIEEMLKKGFPHLKNINEAEKKWISDLARKLNVSLSEKTN